MTTKKLMCFITVVGLSLTIHTTQTLCQDNSLGSLIARDSKRWFSLTREEQEEEAKEFLFQQSQEHLKKGEAKRNQFRLEAWMRLLRITEKQWKLLEPEKDKTATLINEVTRGAYSYGGGVDVDGRHSTTGFQWGTYARMGLAVAPTIDEMTEGQRVVDELIALLDDDNAKDQAIRQKIEALQEARAEARQAIPQAKKALRHTLTSRRQEAVFLLMGLID